MFKAVDRELKRKRRQLRLRKRLAGTSECPRLNVFRSHKNLYIQLIDDTEGRTLFSCSTLKESFQKVSKTGGNVDSARKLGLAAAQEMKTAGFSKIVFDRAGYYYHGRIKALADGLREGGLKF
ncbi:MAG TPA: 50S ribosomal protein L18 [Candidatus Omnitrophota bacterium]|nr:50S ribosomal protein L18 [Candidatus Omnitrophota bacterium]